MKMCESGMCERASTCESCQLTAIQWQLFTSTETALLLYQAATTAFGKQIIFAIFFLPGKGILKADISQKSYLGYRHGSMLENAHRGRQSARLVC